MSASPAVTLRQALIHIKNLKRAVTIGLQGFTTSESIKKEWLEQIEAAEAEIRELIDKHGENHKFALARKLKNEWIFCAAIEAEVEKYHRSMDDELLTNSHNEPIIPPRDIIDNCGIQQILNSLAPLDLQIS